MPALTTKYYAPSKVISVNKNSTYDLEYYDGAVEQGVEKKVLRKVGPDKADEVAGDDVEQQMTKLALADDTTGTLPSTATPDSASPPLPPTASGDNDNDNDNDKNRDSAEANDGHPKEAPKKVQIRFVHDDSEAETTSDLLKPVAWLGTLPSEAAKAQKHNELYKYLDGIEKEARKAAKKKFKAVQALTIGMLAGRDASKYEGMV